MSPPSSPKWVFVRPAPAHSVLVVLVAAVVMGAAVTGCTHGKAGDVGQKLRATTASATPPAPASRTTPRPPVYTGPPRIIGISPPAGLPHGENTIRIVGKGLDATTRVLFGSAVSTKIDQVSRSDIRVVVPEHIAGTVHIRVSGRHGMSTRTTADRYRFTTAPPAPAWRPPTVIDRSSGNLDAVSCPTATFCAAVDGSNHLLTRNGGGTWKRQTVPPREQDHFVPAYFVPSPGTPAFALVSCASATFCLASTARVSYGPKVTYRYDGSTWSLLQPTALTGLSCMPGGTRCIGYRSGSWYNIDNRTWTPRPLSIHLESIACASATFCAALTTSRRIRTFDGNGWSTADESLPMRPVTLSCGAPEFCVALDSKGRASVRTAPGNWSTPASAAPDIQPGYFSCSTASFCLALDDDGHYATYTGTWSAPAKVGLRGPAGALSCFGVNQCRATDDTGAAYEFDGATWTGPETVEPDTGMLAEVSCVARTFCMAVDGQGNALRWNGTAWSQPQQVDDHRPFAGIDCSTTTFCMAVDGDPTNLDEVGIAPAAGRALTFNGTTWSEPTTIDAGRVMSAVSCATPTFCVAVDDVGNVITYRNGRWGEPEPIGHGHGLIDVSCPTRNFCVAADDSSGARVFDGSTWHDESLPLPDIAKGSSTTIECTSANLCLLDGSLLIRHAGVWGLMAVPESVGGGGSISCADPRFCLGTSNSDDFFDTYVFDGGAARSVGERFFGGQVSCAPDRFCAIVASDAAVETA